MTESRRRRGLCTVLILMGLLVPAWAHAQSPSAAEDLRTADIRIAVDISGSMRLNDPDNLRRPAVRLLARLMPEGAGSGLWLFGQQVNMLVPYRQVNEDWRQDMLAASEQISSVALRTNLGAALEQAATVWAGRGFDGPSHVILLTDGLADISADPAVNDRERTRIAEELAPALARQGVVIHGIALSAEADLGLMGLLADITGGSAHVAPNAEALSRVFADALGQVAARDEVPIRGQGFRIDDGVEEFTALIFSEQSLGQRRLALVSPTDTIYSPESVQGSVAWVADTDYDLITITDPAPGEWRIDGELGGGSRVTVVSDLRLAVEPVPSRFRLGESIDIRASFEEEGTLITDPEFLGVIQVVLTLTTEDGRSGARVLSGDAPPQDGVYRDTIARLQEPGTYLLELAADGRTFSRKFRQSLTLIDPDSDQPAIAVPITPSAAEPPPEPPAPASAPQPDITPIDTSLAEKAATTTPEAETPPGDTWLDQLLAWRWWIAGAAGSFLLLAGLLWALLRRRRKAADEAAAPRVDDVLADEPEAQDEVPVAVAGTTDDSIVDDSGPDEQPEARVAPEETEDAEPEIPVLDDGTEPEPEPALEEDLSQTREQDDVFEAELQRIADELPEETLETEPDPEPEPEPEPPVAEPAPQQDDSLPLMDDELPPDELDDEEFGLEDFDLSDIDDLPELDPDEKPESENKPGQSPRKPSNP